MKITVEGDAKEIAALVLELQEQQTLEDLKLSVTNRLQAAIDRNEDVLYADDKPLTEQTQACDYEKWMPRFVSDSDEDGFFDYSQRRSSPFGFEFFNLGESIMRIGEIMFAISFSNFLFGALPKIFQAFFAG